MKKDNEESEGNGVKFLHISDLHLGKRVNGFSMLEDQKYILGKILEIAQREQAEGVLIAGDIYDKPIPPGEAVRMFDWFLTRLADMGKKIFVIGGNHDSAERIAFGAQLMSQRGVHFSPVYDGEIEPIRLKDKYGEICIYLMPFLKPATVRHAWEAKQQEEEKEEWREREKEKREKKEERKEEEREEKAKQQEEEQKREEAERQRDGKKGLPESYEEAAAFAIRHLAIDSGKRNILVAHQFVTGAARCESEEVSVGGVDNISAEVFDAFDYVALGHIHSPQHIKRETVRYCGTPLKYSFSEAEQEKSVTVVELKEKGEVCIVSIPLSPLRDMRRIRGSYQEVMTRSFYEKQNTEDYLEITLTDEEDIPDGMQKLRIIFPNLMRLQYDNIRTRQEQKIEMISEIEKKSELELFMEFYKMQNNQPMGEEQLKFVKHMIEELKE